MKAGVLEEIGKIKVKDVPVPQCKSDQVLLRIRFCGICGADMRDIHHGHPRLRLPGIMGHELSGAVQEIGGKARELVFPIKEGDWVTVAPDIGCEKCEFCYRGQVCANAKSIGYEVPGGFAQQFLVPSSGIRNIFAIPEGVSLKEASLAEPLSCCINAQERLKIEPGDKVVVMGVGPIGCMHAKLAQLRGASEILVVDINPKRLELAKRVLGDADVSYANSHQEDLNKRIKEMTGGKKAEKVIVACPSGSAEEKSLEIVSREGTILFFGGLPKQEPFISFDSNLFHYNNLTIVTSSGATLEHFYLALKLLSIERAHFARIVTHVFPLSEINKGIEVMSKGEGLKTLIEMDEK